MFVNALLGTAPRNLIPRHFAEKKPKYFVKSFMFLPFWTLPIWPHSSQRRRWRGWAVVVVVNLLFCVSQRNLGVISKTIFLLSPPSNNADQRLLPDNQKSRSKCMPQKRSLYFSSGFRCDVRKVASLWRIVL